MTSDERRQLIEDIKINNNKRQDIIERAEMSEDFDIAAAWQELEELDHSIYKRITRARSND